MRKYLIFLVEDSRSDIFLLEEAMREHGIDYELELALDGEEAEQSLQRFAAGARKSPDLIVLDLNLPKIDGIEILRRVKRHVSCAWSPVAVVTSSDSPRDREQVLALGADLFIHKPLHFDDYIAIGGELRNLLEHGTAQGG